MSDNHHYLVKSDGQPFFYLGDTAWELFHRLNREEADVYLQDRAEKGFTVIQAVALAELDGLDDPNAYGFRPLIDHDPARPDVKDGPDNDYWDQVDYIVNKAESLGLCIGFLPTWGDKWNKAWGVGPEIFTPENARIYGAWLGKRYEKKPIIWILGGDRPIENERHRAIIQAMAEGLRAGDGGTHLITLHPSGSHGSAEWFHDAPWLDFNMRQNGHGAEAKGYAQTFADFLRQPAKPVLDGEPIYEDHPVSFKAAEFGYSIAADVRRAVYWDLFNGALGLTYGNHAVWQMWQRNKTPINGPLMPWTEAIHEPGSGQMQFARWLFQSRPFARVPDQELVVPREPNAAWPGAGRYRFAGTRAEDGSYAMIYVPAGRKFSVRLDKISGTTLRAWWYNPRDGHAESLGEINKSAEKEFTPPSLGEALDWILVLDDAAKNYPAPGSR
ncbi:MAG TPA: glycoside hydrolase family 140 protein [Opitutaceae bacterium]|nr:glycoside hydrolase family 140 protein [Opitutaceae bacterium]